MDTISLQPTIEERERDVRIDFDGLLTEVETLKYVARVEYSCSSACGAFELRRMASSKRIYTASNLSGATQKGCDSGEGWEGGVNTPLSVINPTPSVADMMEDQDLRLAP
jgi:hypothetical protein